MSVTRRSPVVLKSSAALLALTLGLAGLAACEGSPGAGGGTGGATPPTTGGTAPATGGGGPSGGATSGGSSAGGSESGGGTAAGGGDPSGGSGGEASGGTGGVPTGGAENLPPSMLSETGLFTSRDANGELVLAAGIREFAPKYWLWSDGADKKRYVYLPPGKKIDTTDPDHWGFPAGTKFWKSFISEGQLVETRLIERTGDGPDDFRFSTYFWETAEATDATRMAYKNQRLNAAGSTHDIPNGMMCERCHNTLRERVAGFSAIQLNHELGGVTLKTLMDEDLLTAPIALDIGIPGADQMTKDALGYLHANCGNCHNDSPGLLLESVPAPQMLLRVLVNDKTLEDTGVFRTAINQATTASAELAIPFRIAGGSIEDSAVYFRMTQRKIEDQMPPIGTEMVDPTGLETIRTWIESLPAPP